jgi:hypothetical protein
VCFNRKIDYKKLFDIKIKRYFIYLPLFLLNLARLVVFDELGAPYIEEELRVGVEFHAVLTISS